MSMQPSKPPPDMWLRISHTTKLRSHLMYVTTVLQAKLLGDGGYIQALSPQFKYHGIGIEWSRAPLSLGPSPENARRHSSMRNRVIIMAHCRKTERKATRKH